MIGGLTAAAAYQITNRKRPALSVLLSGFIPAAAIAAVAVGGGALATAVTSNEAADIALPIAVGVSAVVLHSVVAGVLLGQEAFVRYNTALVLPPVLAVVAISVALWGLDEATPTAALWAFSAGSSRRCRSRCCSRSPRPVPVGPLTGR